MKSLFNLILVSLISAGCHTSSFDPYTATSTSTPSGTRSWVTVTNPTYADGASTSLITVALVNQNGAPIVGKVLTMNLSGTGNTLTVCPPTNAQGISTCTASSTFAETKTLTVTSKITLTATMTFITAPSNQLMAAVVSGGDQQYAPGGQRFITSTGFIESPAVIRDTNGNVRLHSTLQGTLWTQ